MDISVKIGTKITLENPLMPASGPLSGDPKKISFLFSQGVGALVSKTISSKAAMVPRPCNIAGNNYFMNTELWSEFSPEVWEKDFFPQIRKLSKPLFISIGYHKDEIVALINKFEKFADAFEISTHYIEKGLDYAGKIVYAAASSTGKPVFIKLDPNIPDPAAFAQMVKDNGGYGVIATNSLGPVYPLNLQKEGSPLGSENGFGWMSGPALKPFSLSVVRRIAQKVDIPIIGVGGISSAEDVLEYIMAGASAVQLLSAAMMKGKNIYSKIIADIPGTLEKYGYSSFSEIKGKALEKNILPSYEKKIPVINQNNCTMCMLCVNNCPYFALEKDGDKIKVLENECFGCGLCESRCPSKAISGVLYV